MEHRIFIRQPYKTKKLLNAINLPAAIAWGTLILLGIFGAISEIGLYSSSIQTILGFILLFLIPLGGLVSILPPHINHDCVCCVTRAFCRDKI